MATTINIDEAAEAVKTNESNALKALKAKLDTFLEDLAAIEQTLPISLKIDASRIINEIRSSLSYARDASLPQALFRYETATVPAMIPAYAGTGQVAPESGETNG